MSFLTNPYCPNEIITLTPTITTGTAPFNYQWIGTGIQSPTTLSTEIMNPILLCENSFWVYLTTTDSHGCAATDSVFIHYQDNTAPSFSSSIAQYDAIVGLNEYLVPNLTDEVLALAQDFCTTSSSLSIAQIPVASTACTDPTEVIVTVADPCGNSISMTIPLLFLPPLTVDSLNLTPISCFGLEEGTATVWISGGTPPYSYEWNTIPTQTTATASSLSAGSYSVTITDAHNFQTIAFANLIQPDSIVLIATPIHATCGIHNGAIITTVSGGTLPYSFLWNDGIADQNRSNLAKGIYHLLLTDANGCSDTIDILVDSLSVLRATLSNISQDSCGLSAGSLSVAVAGGRAPYSYQWSTGATNTSSISELAAGYYSVSVTDADNCLDIANTILYDYPMVIRADTILHDICGNHNGAIVLSVSNGNSNHYQVDWGGDISDYDALQANHLSEGSYSILVSDGICIVPFTFNINLISAPNADFIITTSPPYFAGNDLRFNDLSQGNMVSWRWNFGDHETSATQHPSHLYQDAGHYTIQLTVTTDYNCVDSTEQEIDVIDYTAIFIPNAFAPYSETNNVFKPIFHNPNPQDYSLEIYDRWGKLLFHSTDIDYGWDGTVNGKLIEYTSTYVYVISYKEVTNTLLHQRRGSVTLITN
jgi:gliding motility-associated-like protein